jgi:methionyl-tRNA formyltransferase
LKLLDVLPLEGGSREHSGSVVSTSCQEVKVGVATGRGLLGIKTLQLEGRQPVSIQEFIQGYPDFLGSRLPS